MTVGRTLGFVLIVLLASGRATAIAPSPASAAVPGRLVIKYRASVDACVHCLLARGIPFAQITGRDSLDRLDRELGVRGARPLFFHRHGLDARAASDAWTERLAA